MKLLLPLVGAALLLAACAGAPTSPTAKQTPNAARHDVSCASGYVVAYDENGNPYCAPE